MALNSQPIFPQPKPSLLLPSLNSPDLPKNKKKLPMPSIWRSNLNKSTSPFDHLDFTNEKIERSSIFSKNKA